MSDQKVLHRRLGLGGAVAVGLAAMLGTGVFAAWTPALRWAGSWLLVSLAIAALVAALNAWSTAALARELPEAGGAYAYGRELLGRPAGMVAGVAFVVGKTASSGAAALTVGAYAWPGHERPVALLTIAVVLLLDLRGVTRTAAASAVSAAVVLALLAVLVGASATQPALDASPAGRGALGTVAAAGLLFVAFAGYARVATLGEEVRDPRHVLPRAIGVALAVVLVAYAAVGWQVLRLLGPLPPAALAAAPLEQLARLAGGDVLATATRVAAVVAAGGALLSLLAGVGRTLFAMGRAGDAPHVLAGVSRHGVPHVAQVAAGCGAAVVSLLGGIGGALALSGVSVLLYYGVAHLAALRLGAGRPPRAVPLLGLAGCLLVAVAVVAVGVGATP